MEKTLLKIIHYGIYLVLFTPLIISTRFFFPFVGPKSIYFFALVEIIFFSYLILISIDSQYRPRKNPLLMVLGAFLVILILSSVFGIDFQNSFWSKYERMTGLLMWFHLFAFFLVLSSVPKRREDWYKIFGVSILAATIISFISLLEKMGIDIVGVSSRGGATLGNSSFLGTYLLFNLFFALYLFLKTNSEKLQTAFSKFFNFYALFGVGLIGLALWFSTARAALLSALGGLVLLWFFWLAFRQKGKLRYVGISVLILGFATVAYLLFLIVHSPNVVEDKLVQQFGTSTIKSRFDVCGMGWQGFKERPLLGWGPENFQVIFTKHFNPKFFTEEYGADIWYDRSHNIIFDTLGMTGVLGFLGYLSIFGAVFYILWKKFLKERSDFWEAGIFSAVLIAYFVQNLTVFDMVGSYSMFFLALGFAGFMGSIRAEAGEAIERKKIKSKFWLIAIISALFVFSFVNSVIQPLRADYYTIEAIKAKPFSEQKLSLYKKTLTLSPVGRDQIREFFADSTLNYSEQYLKDAEKIAEKTREEIGKRILREFDFICQELEKSLKRNPLNFRLQLKLGKVLNSYFRFDQSKLSEAEKALERAIELGPVNQQGYWYLAQTKLFQEKVQEALSLAQTAVDLEPRAEKSHLILIQIARLTGDQELLKEKVENALNINPEWATTIKEVLGG